MESNDFHMNWYSAHWTVHKRTHVQSIGLVIGYLWVNLYKFCRKRLCTLERVLPRHSSTWGFFFSSSLFYYYFPRKISRTIFTDGTNSPWMRLIVSISNGLFDHWFRWNHINALVHMFLFSICIHSSFLFFFKSNFFFFWNQNCTQ